MEVIDRYDSVGGIRTHVLDAGPADGRPTLLLHGGAWGECAAATWKLNVQPLALAGLRVIAPDWLGFGETAKVRDFEDLAGSMIAHIADLLRLLGIDEVDAVGQSMGGSHLLRALTAGPTLPIRRMVLVSAGGPAIDKSAGARLMDYDGTVESMRAQIRLAVADPEWAHDEEYVALRQQAAHRPGAYQFFRSLSLRAPWDDAPATPPLDYGAIDVRTLVVAGERDRLKPAGYSAEVAGAMSCATHRVFAQAGHCPQLEAAEDFNECVIDFLTDPDRQ